MLESTKLKVKEFGCRLNRQDEVITKAELKISSVAVVVEEEKRI